MTDLCFRKATELAGLIATRQISAREVMEAHLAQIDCGNPRVNAIVTLLADQALEQAVAADERQTQGEALGPLHGLPIAHKDLVLTKGIRTTFGSPICENFVPTEDAFIVGRHQDDFGVLQLGYAFQEATECWKRQPEIARMEKFS